MQLLGGFGQHLCGLPARADQPGVNAGLTFTVPRATEALVDSAQALWIIERLAELETGLKLVAAYQPALRPLLPRLHAFCSDYRRALAQSEVRC